MERLGELLVIMPMANAAKAIKYDPKLTMADVSNDASAEYEIDGCLRIPRVECNQDSFFQHLPRLNIRELLCWALRTETSVRLSKIQNPSSNSKTLNSDYLIDLYPEDESIAGSNNDFTPKGRDEYKFSRKVHPQITFLDIAGNIGLTPIVIEKKNRKEQYGYGCDEDVSTRRKKTFAGKKVVPPTLLHFEIVLEAYMGYSLSCGTNQSCYNSPNSSLPRSAVMGGAVVSALTSYQDEEIVKALENSGLFSKEGKLAEEGFYWTAKKSLIKYIHEYFLYKGGKKQVQFFKKKEKQGRNGPTSLYSQGDVDIFLQSSTLTRGLLDALSSHGLPLTLIGIIGSYVDVGNNGLCKMDLELFVTKVMGQDRDGVVTAPKDTSFAFAVSKSAVSFILGLAPDINWEYYDYTELNNILWPRSSQFIILAPSADLLGGLLDFDMSVVACSYDGVSVRVAPRAALSLMTNCNFVTPFCFEEHRNKRRVIKYASRGFQPFLVDPHDNRSRQNPACDTKIARNPFLPKEGLPSRMRNETQSEEILRIQESKMQSEDLMFCCHTLEPASYGKKYYTMMLFETSPGDAFNFFKERFSWSKDDTESVNNIDPYLRMACATCKHEYILVRVLLPKYPALIKEYDIEDDNLRGKFAYKHTTGGNFHPRFKPSFYGGGVFDSRFVRKHARGVCETLSMLHAQSIFEVSRYVMKHGTPGGYQRRFVHGRDLHQTLQKASKTPLQKPARPPIGLNPERFVEACPQCKRYLLGNRYGLKDCERCGTGSSKGKDSTTSSTSSRKRKAETPKTSLRICFGCGNTKSSNDFSKSQRRKGGSAKCMSCVSVPKIGTKTKQPKESSMLKSETTKKITPLGGLLAGYGSSSDEDN